MDDLTYGLILGSLFEGVCTIDQDWNIISFNKAAEEITGISAEEAMNGPLSRVFNPEVCNCVSTLTEVLAKGNKVSGMATHIQCRRGESILIKLNASPLYTGGRIIGAVMTFLDDSEVEILRGQLGCEYAAHGIISQSSAMDGVLKLLPNVAASLSPVLVLGESGTGKELVARAIHGQSGRNKKPFIAVNCGALPDNLLESELFGYRKGAFTDARQDKPGRFALAEGGTLFLDEIGDITLSMQVKLLRVLQEKEYEPLGGTEPVPSNVRIIAATNKDLREMMRSGAFRSDLYYRLNVVELLLPPLRERKLDIPLLVQHFIRKYNATTGKTIRGINQEAVNRLMQYDFPGNIRELENIIERAYIMCPHQEIQAGCLPAMESFAQATPCRVLSEVAPPTARPARLLPEEEKAMITASLERHRHHRRATANELGIDPSTLWRKMKKYGLMA